jgi:hypothetical protein
MACRTLLFLAARDDISPDFFTTSESSARRFAVALFQLRFEAAAFVPCIAAETVLPEQEPVPAALGRFTGRNLRNAANDLDIQYSQVIY